MIEIAATGNLVSAARNLGVSQSALSRYIERTERYLGTSIFYYEGRKMHLTDAGRIYLSGITRMKNMELHMIREFHGLKNSRPVCLNIGISHFRGGREIAMFYPRLLEKFPTIKLLTEEGSTSHLLQLLKEHRISSILSLYDSRLMPGCKAATILKTEVLLVLPDYHPLAAKGGSLENPAVITSAELGSLLDVPFVLYNQDTILGQKTDKILKKHAFHPKVFLETSNSITISNLLSSGDYAGMVQQNSSTIQRVKYFRFEHSEYLYSAMIFLGNYFPTSVEKALYAMEIEHAKIENPHLLSINTFGNSLLEDHGQRLFQ